MSHPAQTYHCSGYCPRCKEEHQLQTGGLSETHARELLLEMEEVGKIDIFSKTPATPLDSLWGDARGKMFGVLHCQKPTGETVFLYAFSGQFLGLWNIEGWAPPLFDVDSWNTTIDINEKRIKKLSAHIDQLINTEGSTKAISALKKRRKILSQNLMKAIHSLYEVHSFNKEKSDLHHAFLTPQKIPTGAGDCCAPKLINLAHTRGLHPVSITEFYFGKANKSKTKEHGSFYSSCASKCAPLLGYMLCPKNLK